MKKIVAFTVLVAVVGSSLYGCGIPMMPSGSATLITSDIKKGSNRAVSVGDVVSESECHYGLLFFIEFGNFRPSHEQLIGKILEQSKADILLDADLSHAWITIPLVFSMDCASVTGQPARLIAIKEVKK